MPRKERRSWNAILKDSRCGKLAPITDCPPAPLGAEVEPVGVVVTEGGVVFRRRDSWDQEEYTEAEVTAGWVALE